jgi:hypothetical protein
MRWLGRRHRRSYWDSPFWTRRREGLSERQPVDQGLAGALPEVGRYRMGRITQQRHVAPDVRGQWRAAYQFARPGSSAG